MLTLVMFLLMTFVPSFKNTFMLILNIKVLHMTSLYVISIGIDAICIFFIYALARKAFDEVHNYE